MSAYLSTNGCDLLDHPPARLLLTYHFHCFPRYGQETEEIPIHLLFDLDFRVLFERPAKVAACIIDDYIYATELFKSGREG